MALCKNDVLQSLQNAVAKELSEGKTPQEINDRYGHTVVAEDGTVSIPQELVDKYWEANKPESKIKADRIEDIFKQVRDIALNSGIKKVGSNEGYVNKEGVPVKRVSDITQAYYDKIFPPDPEKKAKKNIDSVESERGTHFHSDMENMFRLFIDPYSGKKSYATREEMDKIDISGFIPQMKVTDKFKEEYINKIAGYVKDRLDTYSEDARFLFETVVYNKAKNVAGTIDFIAIDHSGIDILDWKTINKLSDEGKIYPTKRKGFNIQLNQYYKAIKNSLDLSDNDFNYIRVIPILPSQNTRKEVFNIDIGRVDNKDSQIALLPVLSHLDVAYKGSVKKALDAFNEIQNRENIRLSREKGFKNQTDYKLNEEIDEAIQQVVTQQNPEGLFKFLDDVLKRVDDYIKQTEEFSTSSQDASREDIIRVAEKLNDARVAIKGVQDFFNFSEENLSDYKNASEENRSQINNYSDRITGYLNKYAKANKAYFIKAALSNNISAIEKAQIEITTLQKWTTNLHTAPKTKTVELLSKVLLPVHNQMDLDKEDAKLKVKTFSENLKEWGKKNSKSIQQVYDMFLSKDKDGKFNGKLNSKIDPEFYVKSKEAFAGKERLKFVSDNYNLSEYNKAVDEFLATENARIDGMSTTNEQKTRVKEGLIKKYKTPGTAYTSKNKFLHSIDENGDYRFIKQDKWYSSFYKEIQKPGNETLLEFYKYITSLNRRAKQTGLSETKALNIPHIQKGMLETGWDFKKQRDRYLQSIGRDITKYQFGDVDPITGMNRERMFLPYTQDLSQKGADGKRDYSHLSTDLSRIFGAFEQSLLEVEGVQNLDSFAQLIRDFETTSKVFDVNVFGNPTKNRDTNQFIELSKGTASTNYQYLDKFVKLYIYGIKMQDFKDLAIATPFKDKEGNTQHLSGLALVQSTAQLARYTLLGGLNITAPLRNFVMGRLSTAVQKSTYFSSTSSLSNAIEFMEKFKFSLTNPKHQKMAASLAYFLPHGMSEGKFKDSVSIYAGYQMLTPEHLMKIMQKSEEWVKLPIHFALMENSTVRDGKIVNINEWVEAQTKKKHGYDNIYRLPAAQQKEIQKEMAAEKKKLIKEDNLYNYMELTKEGKDTTMKIKGVERNDPSVKHIRNITDDLLSKSTGTTTDKNKSLAPTSFMMQMLSMFRSWIPRTVQARFGELNKNNLTDHYEEGRMRSLWQSVLNSHQGKLKTLGSFLGAFVGVHNKENLVKTIQQVYEKKAAEMQKLNKIERKGEINEEEFTRMYLDNIDSAYRDLRVTAGLILVVTSGLLAAGGAGSGDSDDEKNVKRLLARELAKYSQEFSFYYNPISAFQIIKDPFPILSFHSNLAMIAEQTMAALAGSDTAHPGKYVLKSLPLTSFFIQYMPFFDPSLAKEWNIHFNPNAFNR